ncbi:hypothetical protein U1Q18_014782 [Sarracenia purpurea var. burkii]
MGSYFKAGPNDMLSAQNVLDKMPQLSPEGKTKGVEVNQEQVTVGMQRRLRNNVSLSNCGIIGMPECKLGLNDKVMLEAQGRATKGKAIGLDDIKFHHTATNVKIQLPVPFDATNPNV